jgi:microcystin-dependent protein
MDPYLGEIKLWALNYAPQGWALCNGALLSIQSNTALYSLLGTQYGGDGVRTFALPDLRGRVPVANGNVKVGATGGEETVTLTAQQMPQHTHPVNVYPNAADKGPGLGSHIAAPVTKTTPTTNLNLYAAASANQVALNPATVSTAGSGATHDNMQPWLALNYYIATVGVYPSHP